MRSETNGFERVRRAGDGQRRNSGIARRGVDRTVAEQHLNDAGIGSVFEKMWGEGVAEGVGCDAFREARLRGGFAAGQRNAPVVRCLPLRQEGNSQSRGEGRLAAMRSDGVTGSVERQ